MRHSFLLSTLALLTLTSAVGCDARRGGNGDDDDDANIALAGLDTNGDGVLTDDDLSAGSAGVYTRTTDDAGETEDGETSNQGYITSGDGAFGVAMESGGTIPMSFTLWFMDPSFDDSWLSEGEGDYQWINASSDEYLLWSPSGSGTVTITEVTGEGASGWFEGEIEITVADQFESPTGQTVFIEGFAFNDLPYAE